jgi:cell division protein FtsQ
MMAQHHYSFPVVTGLDPQDPPASRKARMASYQRLLSELDSNGQHLSEQISEIDLTDSEDARVLMPEQGTDILAHFGADHFLERYQRYKAHIAEWRQQYPNLAAVDLRYEQQVVLEMAHGASAVQPTQVASATPSAPSADAPPAAQPDPKPADATPSKPKPGLHADAVPAMPSGASQAPSVTKASADTKPAANKSSKAQAAARKAAAIRALTAKDKAARDKKKRAEARRAALNAGKQKAPSTTHHSASAAEGQ